MTSTAYQMTLALFVVVYRDAQARHRLTEWSRSSRSIQCRVEDNRMHLFDHNNMSLFRVTWSHGWDSVMIWDTWLRRHVMV
jgi:hypothetical protein